MTLATDPLERLDAVPRSRLATLPTALERGPGLPGGVRLWVKRDDLTGLGAGGNKARKLEFLCGEALRSGARSLVTVGAGQSNHCRMTAAAGAVLGLEVHLVLSGSRPQHATGNQLLAELFGAQLHYVGCPPSHWGELEIAREQLTIDLQTQGAAPHSIPIGGSTAVGAVGYLVAYVELVEQCRKVGMRPAAVVHTSSSGGTHAGLVAGRALLRSLGHDELPDVLAIGVAKGVVAGHPDVRDLAVDTLAVLGIDDVEIGDDAVEIDTRWLGPDYGTPTPAGDEAIRWAALHGGWVLDRTYTGRASPACSATPPPVAGEPAPTSSSFTPAGSPPSSPTTACPPDVRVFVAGVTGVIGVRLVPLLVAAGHEVAGMTRSPQKVDHLVALGGEPVVCDVFDADALIAAVAAFAPDVVVHQLTDLPDQARDLAGYSAANARIRREGTRNLIAARAAAGARRFIAQSVAWALPGRGAAAVADMEQMVLAADGVVVRYGQFFGPGTYWETELPEPPRIHVDEAASRTLDLLEEPSGIVTVIA